jgi:hypothetical protein
MSKGELGASPTVSIERAVAYRPALALALRDVKAALMLSQALWKQSTVGVHEWWHCTRYEWEAWTGMRRREQDRARKVLRERGLLCEKRARANTAVMYCVDVEAVNNLCPAEPVVAESMAPNVPGNGTERTDGAGASVQVPARIMRTRGERTKKNRFNNARTPGHAREMRSVGAMLGAEKVTRDVDVPKQLNFLRLKVRGIENGADLGVPMTPHVHEALAVADTLLPVLERDERAEVKALRRRLRTVLDANAGVSKSRRA